MKNQKLNIWNFFVLKHRFAMLVVFLAILLGTIAVFQVPKESSPEVDIPFVVVNTAFVGAGAEDVEELVTNVIEDKLLGLEGVEDITSTSREGFSSIVVEFDPQQKEIDQKVVVSDKVDEAISDLPENIEDPTVNKIEASDEAILRLSLSGPYSKIQLKKYAEKIEEEIERVPKVSSVSVVGGEEREIKVLVDKARLDSYGLRLSQVTGAISQANTNIPTGVLDTKSGEYAIRLAGRITETEEIKKVPIAAISDSVILVEDVAEVVDGYEEETSISRLSVDGSDPLPAISINVFKSKGGNILRLVDETNQILENYQNNILPEDVRIEITTDLADFIREDLNRLFKNGVQTVLIILLLLSFLVGIREALIASFAVPLSFLITFIFLPVFDLTINFLSLFSLILALGILIDTAVVITERMNFYIKKKEFKAKEAALATIEEFKWPLLAGTLTTVFAFLPMLLTTGIMGQYIRVIPITVTVVLLSSIFVGLAIVPVLGARFLDRKNGDSKIKQCCKGVRNFVAKTLFNNTVGRYRNLLTKLLENRRMQRFFFLGVLILFLAGISLPIFGILEVNMFPSEDADLFWVDIKKPIGTSLEETSESALKLEEILRQEPDIASFSVTVGSSIMSGSGDNYAGIVVNLKEDKQKDSRELVSKYQRIFNNKINAEVSIFEIGSGPPSSAPIVATVEGDNPETLEAIVFDLEKLLKSIPGSRNVKTNIEESKGEFVFQIDRAKAQLFGVSAIELAQVLRNAVKGSTATTIKKQGEEISVMVKYKGLDSGSDNDISINALENITIRTTQGDIPLSAFTNVELSGARPSIRHQGGARTYQVTGYTQTGTAPIAVIQEFQETIEKSINLPQGYEISFGGEQEDINQTYRDMFRAMILAVFLIASVLILQFDSLRQPLFILSSIPLAFIGVFPGLVLADKDFTFPAIVGVVALAGVVVNNGIILVDMMNRNLKAGMVKKEAVLEAGLVRFRPIILTTITTIVGILPITLSSELWGGLGFTLIFGLLVSAGLTLLMVPLLYFKFESSFER